MTTSDRQRGCLLGLAIGDTWGQQSSFDCRVALLQSRITEPADRIAWILVNGLTIRAWPWLWPTVLPRPAGILTAAWDVNWWRNGKYSVNDTCFDIGITTRSAQSRFMQSKDAYSSGDRSERAWRNGPNMRQAPRSAGE